MGGHVVMPDSVAKIEVFLVALTQPTPYLGSLRKNEEVNQNGYFVRRGNRTVYPIANRSIVVRVETRKGLEGWGETYGLVAPRATTEIISDLLIPFVLERFPSDVESIHDELSDLMQVRGYVGGFYSDALAAIDIALWDLFGKQEDVSLRELIQGESTTSIPAYVSGLPRDTLQDRCTLASHWKSKGFDAFKFALPVADDGPLAELEALRMALGPEASIACDMHWAYTADEALLYDKRMAGNNPWFLEAPVATEDVTGLAAVAKHANAPIAVGEEWRTLHDARRRIDAAACHIIQPEMGHTGVTQFIRMSRYAEQHNLILMPHATIGSGIFLAASLQAASTFAATEFHEYQHSIFDTFRSFTHGGMDCLEGHYHLPKGVGIGVEPTDEMKQQMTQIC